MSLFGLVHQFRRDKLTLRGLEGDNNRRLVTLFGDHIIELGKNVENQLTAAPPATPGSSGNINSSTPGQIAPADDQGQRDRSESSNSTST